METRPVNSHQRFARISAIAIAAALSLAAAQAAPNQDRGRRGLSGRCGPVRPSIKNGLQLAADEINAAGRRQRRQDRAAIEDEQGKKEQAIDVFKKLIFQDKVLMVFGPTLSNSAQAADPIAQGRRRVRRLNTADGIIEIGDFVFRDSLTEATSCRTRSRWRQGQEASEGRRAVRQRRRLHQGRLRRLQQGAGRPEDSGRGHRDVREGRHRLLGPADEDHGHQPRRHRAVGADRRRRAGIMVQARQLGTRTCRSSAATA